MRYKTYHGPRKLHNQVIRSTARVTNLSVILLGASLSAVLGWALATELFARNSPTVLYGDACEKIKASSDVSEIGCSAIDGS